MPKAVRMHSTGGPEVLRWEDVEVGRPGPGEVLIRQTAVGLNFIDVYFRSGQAFYTAPEPPRLPAIIGLEAAGVIEEVGPGVRGLRPGRRVAYCHRPAGAYAQARVYPARSVVALPDAIDDRTAAAMMFKGLTAYYLIRRAYRVRRGDTILVHAAAGGVGTILCQWAKRLGATVIGTVGSDDKARLAHGRGCDHAIVYTREDFAERVREITQGRGVAVAYDSVGRDTFEGSLDCLRLRGTLVSYGNASGPVAPIDPLSLGHRGSLFLTRATLIHYTGTRPELLAGARELFDVVLGGYVRIEVGHTYPLAEAAAAHRDIEARRTTGSVILIP